MLNRYKVLDAFFIGILSGGLMGLLLKLVEYKTEVRVYTLLLNVDFIPIIGQINWSEPIEFIYHLLISIAVAFVFIYLADREPQLKLWLISFILCLPTIILYFPLSNLALKEVPAWNDWIAFSFWSIAHFFYAWSLPILYKITKKRSTSLR